MKQCYAYLRCSSSGQADGDTWDRQMEAVERYAAEHNLEIIQDFRDSGVPGKTELAYRPALQELKLAIQNRPSQDSPTIVLIEKLDRLARDLMIQETILLKMKEDCGAQFVSTMEPDLYSTDPSRVLMRQIMGAIAQYDKCMIVGKLRSARDRIKARDGRCDGIKPYGLLPGEEETLQRILTMRAAGSLCKDIAAALNGDGILSRSGGRWHTGTVSGILARKPVFPKCAPSAQVNLLDVGAPAILSQQQ